MSSGDLSRAVHAFPHRELASELDRLFTKLPWSSVFRVRASRNDLAPVRLRIPGAGVGRGQGWR
jgi:hypothetical protein